MPETNLLTETTDQAGPVPQIQSVRPDGIPDKFWDPETSTLRLEALLKSYRELERRFAVRDVSVEKMDEEKPLDRDVLLRELGRPDTPDGYDVKCDHGYFTPDPDLHTRLHDLGFTNDQVQAVYDLARDKLVPMMLDLVADVTAEQELDRLVRHYGGLDKWRVVSRQILAFGRKYLSPETLAHLATTFDGVMMIDRMMRIQNGDGAGPAGIGEARNDLGADQLYALMKDPKYWRDHDPKIMAKVQAGFERMYD